MSAVEIVSEAQTSWSDWFEPGPTAFHSELFGETSADRQSD